MNTIMTYGLIICGGISAGLFSYWSFLYSLKKRNFTHYGILSFAKIVLLGYFLYLMLKTSTIPSILVISLGLCSYLGTLLLCKEKIRG